MRFRSLSVSLPLLAGLVLLAAGCSGPLVRDSPTPTRSALFPNHSVADILTAVAAETIPLRAFSSQSRIRVQSPEQRATLTARLRQTPDTLFGTLSGPLGIRVGEGLVTPDSFFVDLAIQNAYYLGPLRAAEQYVPLPPTSADLFASLTGTVAPSREQQWTVASDSVYYYLTASLPSAYGNVERRLTVDPALWRVVEATEVGPDGRVIGTRSFSAFDRVGDLVVPRRVVLTAPTEAMTVTIEHLQVSVNPTALAFPRPDPGRADVTRVE